MFPDAFDGDASVERSVVVMSRCDRWLGSRSREAMVEVAELVLFRRGGEAGGSRVAFSTNVLQP